MKKENDDEIKEEDTMVMTTKPTNQAFILCEKKVEDFLKQDNNQFKNAMTRFEKFKTKKKS